MSLRERGKQQRRERIIRSAIELLRQGGLGELSAARIAERAQVSVATLYNLIGSMDDIFAHLVEHLFAGAIENRSASGTTNVVEQIIDTVHATYHFLQQDAANYQVVIKAIFQLNLEKRCTKPAFLTASTQRNDMAEILKRGVKDGLISKHANTHLIAEQMNIMSVMLLENWSASLISLDYFRYACELNYLMMLKAWSTQKSSPLIEEKLLQSQISLSQVSDIKACSKQARAF